ncbi:hypothetical protein IWZ00DRAFT_495646 [Phyllosticta capitalensis]
MVSGTQQYAQIDQYDLYPSGIYYDPREQEENEAAGKLDNFADHAAYSNLSNQRQSETSKSLSLQNPPHQLRQANVLVSRRPTNQPMTYVPLLGVSVKVSIKSLLAETFLTQTFENHSGSTIKSAKYAFPVHPGCVIRSFRCKVGKNKEMVTRVESKEEARSQFNQAVHENKTAAILEEHTIEVFEVSLGNIPPHQNVSVQISFVGELKPDSASQQNSSAGASYSTSGVVLTLPTSIAPRYGKCPGAFGNGSRSSVNLKGLDIQVDISMPFRILGAECQTHPVSFTVGSMSQDGLSNLNPGDYDYKKANVRLKNRSVSLGRDFVLLVKLSQQISHSIAIVEPHSNIENQCAMMVSVSPRDFLPQIEITHDYTGEIIFVVDCSGSMRSKIQDLRDALQVCLRGLQEQSFFNICQFGSNHRLLWETSQPVSKWTIDHACSMVKDLHSDMGRTNILSALQHATRRPRADSSTSVLIITDGESWDADNISSFVRNSHRNQGLHYFCLGIGNRVSHALVEGIATNGGGLSEVVPTDTDTDWRLRVIHLLTECMNPVSWKLEVEVGGDVDQEHQPPRISCSSHSALRSLGLNPPSIVQAPARIPNSHTLSRISVYLLLSKGAQQACEDKVTIKGRLPSGEQAQITLTPEILDKKPHVVHPLAAKEFLTDLENETAWPFSEQFKSLRKSQPSEFRRSIKEEAESLGKAWSIASKWTSFIAVDKACQKQKAFLDQYRPPKIDTSELETPRINMIHMRALPAASNMRQRALLDTTVLQRHEEPRQKQRNYLEESIEAEPGLPEESNGDPLQTAMEESQSAVNGQDRQNASPIHPGNETPFSASPPLSSIKMEHTDGFLKSPKASDFSTAPTNADQAADYSSVPHSWRPIMDHRFNRKPVLHQGSQAAARAQLFGNLHDGLPSISASPDPATSFSPRRRDLSPTIELVTEDSSDEKENGIFQEAIYDPSEGEKNEFAESIRKVAPSKPSAYHSLPLKRRPGTPRQVRTTPNIIEPSHYNEIQCDHLVRRNAIDDTTAPTSSHSDARHERPDKSNFILDDRERRAEEYIQGVNGISLDSPIGILRTVSNRRLEKTSSRPRFDVSSPSLDSESRVSDLERARNRNTNKLTVKVHNDISALDGNTNGFDEEDGPRLARQFATLSVRGTGKERSATRPDSRNSEVKAQTVVENSQFKHRGHPTRRNTVYNTTVSSQAQSRNSRREEAYERRRVQRHDSIDDSDEEDDRRFTRRGMSATSPDSRNQVVWESLQSDDHRRGYLTRRNQNKRPALAAIGASGATSMGINSSASPRPQKLIGPYYNPEATQPQSYYGLGAMGLRPSLVPRQRHPMRGDGLPVHSGVVQAGAMPYYQGYEAYPPMMPYRYPPHYPPHLPREPSPPPPRRRPPKPTPPPADDPAPAPAPPVPAMVPIPSPVALQATPHAPIPEGLKLVERLKKLEDLLQLQMEAEVGSATTSKSSGNLGEDALQKPRGIFRKPTQKFPEDPSQKPKGIFRKPTEKFPEDSNSVHEADAQREGFDLAAVGAADHSRTNKKTEKKSVSESKTSSSFAFRTQTNDPGIPSKFLAAPFARGICDVPYDSALDLSQSLGTPSPPPATMSKISISGFRCVHKHDDGLQRATRFSGFISQKLEGSSHPNDVNVTSKSRKAKEEYSTQTAPSYESQRKESSPSKDFRQPVPQHTQEELSGNHGLPSAPAPPYMNSETTGEVFGFATNRDCVFSFTGCASSFSNIDEGETHILDHFGICTPPQHVACPLCDLQFKGARDEPPDHKVWNLLMDHLLLHHEPGAVSSQSARLGLYLVEAGVMSEVQHRQFGDIFTRYAGPEFLSLDELIDSISTSGYWELVPQKAEILQRFFSSEKINQMTAEIESSELAGASDKMRLVQTALVVVYLEKEFHDHLPLLGLLLKKAKRWVYKTLLDEVERDRAQDLAREAWLGTNGEG